MINILVGLIGFVALALSLYHFESVINPGVSTRYSDFDFLEKFIFDLEPEWDRVMNGVSAIVGLILIGLAHRVTPVLGLVPGLGIAVYSLLRLKKHSLWPF